MCIIEYVFIIENGLGGLKLIMPFTCKSCFCIQRNYLANAVYPEVSLYCAENFTGLFTLFQDFLQNI